MTGEQIIDGEGHSRLHSWFGLSYASFSVLPRILMQEMSDEWQGKMAELLEQFDETFPNSNIETRVLCTRGNKLVPWPSWVLNYRYPDQSEIGRCRAAQEPR